jgi:hypothetical protein
VVYHDNTTNQITIDYRNAAGASTATATIAVEPVNFLSCFMVPDGNKPKLIVMYQVTGTLDLDYRVFEDTTQLVAGTWASPGSAAFGTGSLEVDNFGPPSAVTAGGNVRRLRLWANVRDGSSVPHLITRSASLTEAAFGSLNTATNGPVLASKAFTHNYRSCVWAITDWYDGGAPGENDQLSNVLLSFRNTSNGGSAYREEPIARLFYRRAFGGQPGGAFADAHNLPSVSSLGSSKWLWPAMVQGHTASEAGIKAVVTEIDAVNALPFAQLGQSLYFGGGYLGLYDGRLREANFHLTPDRPTAGSVSATGGHIDDGTRIYVCTYEWDDANGERHRSAPSEPLSVEFSLGGVIQKVTISFPKLIREIHPEKRDTTKIALYRTTLASNAVFYKLTEAYLVASPTSFEDLQADASIVGYEQLYTTGEVLENSSAPCPKELIAAKNRLLAVPYDDPRTVWISKEKEEGLPVEFSEFQTKHIDTSEDITALAEMDGEVVVFTPTRIRTFSGDGPASTGVGGAFTADRQVPTDVGCASRPSVVKTPVGVMFKSLKGIYLLSRSFEVSYIGAPVESYNSAAILSAKLIGTERQVRFVTDAGVILVYDYHHGIWTTFGVSGVSSANIESDYYVQKANGDIIKESHSVFTDDGASYSMDIRTPWYCLAGLMGFQRVWWVHLLGSVESNHTLTIDVYHGYDGDTVVESHTIDTSDMTAAEKKAALVRFKPTNQVCTSMQLRIRDSAQSGSQKSFTLTGVRFEYGAKTKTRQRAALTM